MSDEALYLQATEEVESNARNSGLWAKSIALAEGDVNKAKYKYIKLRVAQLNLIDIKPNRLAKKEDLSFPFDLFNNLTQEQILQTIDQPFSNRFGSDFSIKSSKLLEDKGRKLLAIHLGYIAPSTIDEHSFAEFISGNKPATTTTETTWEKYIYLATKKPLIMLSCRGSGRGGMVFDEGNEEVDLFYENGRD
tara:strand:- start:158 stop:733 length:576 start_codon:yes stop_codon:yes gene_type:complete